MKYLLPGLFFLTVFGIYPVLYTAYASTTNYGTGHVLSQVAGDRSDPEPVRPAGGRGDAVRHHADEGRQRAVRRVRPVRPGGRAAVPRHRHRAHRARPRRCPTHHLGDHGPDVRRVGRRPHRCARRRRADAAGLPGSRDLPDARRDRGCGDHDLGRPGGGEPLHPRLRRRRRHDHRRRRPENPIVYHEREGTFVADDGTALRPGFTSQVGFDNYREVFTSSEFQGPFFRVLAWNFAFAVASVVVTFALGLLLAVVFNDARMRGRKIYRSLIIIPYALPGFMTALVWRGMFNETYGINKWLPFDVSWQSSTIVAMFSLILVNMWLGYPYMFLVSTGALQSVPTDLKEAAFVDGATGWKAFRKITFPLLLVSVSPLLVASFAFNFNNFTLVWLLTGGRPARHRRERRDDRHPAVVGLPRRPRRQPAAPGPRRRPVGDHLPDRRRDLGDRVQVHQGVRGGEVSSDDATYEEGIYSVGKYPAAGMAVALRATITARPPTPAAVRAVVPRDRVATHRRRARPALRPLPGVVRRPRRVLRERLAEQPDSCGRNRSPWTSSGTSSTGIRSGGGSSTRWSISLVTSASTVLLAASAAFAFSRLRFTGRRRRTAGPAC